MAPAAEGDRNKGTSPFSPNFRGKSSEESSEDVSVEKSEELSEEKKGRARSSGRRALRRERHERPFQWSKGRDHSARRRTRREKAKAGEHRRRRRHHSSRGVDKRRRSESSHAQKEPSARRASKSRAAPEGVRPRSPPEEPSHKGGTKACPYCWAEITLQQSGRLQHQWVSKHCLAWQFWNGIDEKTKKDKPKAAWEQAKKAATLLYEKRRNLAAPHQAHGELPPAPPLVLRSRSTVAKARPARPVVEEEFEEVEEELPPAKPTRPAAAQRSSVAIPAPAPPAAPASAGKIGSGQSSTGKQQIVINING